MAEFQIYSSLGGPSKVSPQRQSRQGSPSRYDVDFYRRKSGRLQEQLLTLSDEMNKARLRLRRAQDFQIKYDLLLKQKTSLQQTSLRRDKQFFQLRSKNEEMAMRLMERGAKTEEKSNQVEKLLKEIQIWKEKALEAEERCRITVAEEQDRASEKIARELLGVRRNFEEAEKDYKLQIAKLRKELQEKQTVDTGASERQDKIKKEKDSQISRLQGVIERHREDYLQMTDEKNREIIREKEKFQQLLSEGLGSLQKNMNGQDEKFKLQLGGLRKVIELKNEEISNLQNELNIALQASVKEREEFNNEILLLKQKIYDRERANEQEIFNMKERLTTLHAVDIEAFQRHYEDLIEGLKDERRYLEGIMKEQDGKLEYERKEFERGQDQLNKVVSDRDRIIAELKQRLNLTGATNGSEINNLQQSLNQFANEKESLSNEYQANIAFLNQQITKLTASNQLKNNQIRQLHQYNALLKKQQFQAIRQLQNKWKQERKDRQSQRQRQRDLRQKIEEQYRQKQKNWKNRERQLQRDIQKEKRQKSRWAINNEKLQKQVERLYKQNIQLQQKCKNQESKNQKTIIGGGGAKRELTNQLERQKADYQAIKRMEIDQVKKKYQLQLTRLNHITEKLQNQLANKKIDYQNLEDQFKKVSSQYKNMEKIGKEKLSDYNKKMSTLNSEILLTQNLYQSLIGAKAKVIKKQVS